MRKLYVVMIIIVLVAFSVIIALIAESEGYDKGYEMGKTEALVQAKLFGPSYTLWQEGYLTFELKYIEREGWFLIDQNSSPPFLMYRLEVWLESHTPDSRYIYEYFVDGYRRGVMSIYFARP